LDLSAGSRNMPESLSRESNLLEGAARPSCLNTDIEHASVCVSPAYARVASKTLDVSNEFLRCRLGRHDDASWIENQPTRVRPTFRN
jgi:hypothetical protein